MSYRLVVCPACGRQVQAQIKRDQPGVFVGLHTPLNGTGRLCIGTGQEVS